MEARSRIFVGLPHPNPTTPYWQAPPDQIADLRSTSSLPGEADYVIIGSGISAASIAYHLLKAKSEASIIMLEARQACSGATGRNGGHTKAASYRSFLDHEAHYGLEEAIEIARMEYANIVATHAFAAAHNIDCASHPCDTVDILYSAAHLAAGEKAIARMRETMGPADPAAAYTIHSASEAHSRFLAPSALGAITYPAGSISGYKFTVGVIKLCLSLGLNLQTNTPATCISPSSATAQKWTVTTPRGPISTRTVLLATNGYTPHLLTQFHSIIVPLRGQISAQTPGPRLPNHGALSHTYSFIYDVGYEYMITRPSGTSDAGTVIIGGGLGTLPNDGAEEYGRTDDDGLNPALSMYLAECTERYFGVDWGGDDLAGLVKGEWSGIMGTSADGLPYVGQVPGKEGVWVSVSFNGHGMVLCWKCGQALVEMILDEKAKTEDVMYGEVDKRSRCSVYSEVSGKIDDKIDSKASGESAGKACGKVTGSADEDINGRMSEKRTATWRTWFPQSMLLSKERFDRKFVGRVGMRAPGEAEFGVRPCE